MRKLGALLIAHTLAAAAAGCGSSSLTTQAPALPAHEVDALLDDPAFANAFWGAKIVDTENGTVLYERNGQKSFIPASNMKLYSSAAALDALGPDWTWTTAVFASGEIRNDTLDGDLFVRGAGDPSLGSRFIDVEPTAVFRDWADSLKEAGVRHITGRVVGDDDTFDDLPLGRGWMWDDESTWYNSELGALTYHDNTVDLIIEGKEPGDTAAVYWAPLSTSYVEIVNQTTTADANSPADLDVERRRATNVIEVSGSVPAGRVAERRVTVTNTTLFFTHVLTEVLADEGITVGAGPVDIDELFHKPHYSDPALLRIASTPSPTVADLAAVVNKPSNNLYAENLLKLVGLERARRQVSETGGSRHSDETPLATYLPAGTAEAGSATVLELLARAGADTSSVRIVDGSGLSRYNLITPDATVALLNYMWAHPDPAVASAFVESLPIGGVDGTIEDLITDGPAVGNLKAKTGTMTQVRALSGYVTTSRGRTLAFSLISNNHTVPTKEVNNVQRKLVDLLARL